MKKVFVADDDFGHLYKLNTWFKKKGFYVRTFSQSQSLFDAFEELVPDIVMLDTNLSGKNSDEICKEIKSRYNHSVSVILSSVDESDLKKTKLGFADGRLHKPFDAEEMADLLKTCLLQ